MLGCHLNAGTIFPRAGAFPAPFAAFLGGAPGTLNVAPVLIGQNQSQDGVSDVIMVMSGSGSAGGVSRQISGGGSAITATLDNTVGFANGDLLLVSQSGVPDCLMEEVAAIAPPTLNLGGTYYTAAAATSTMASLAANTASYITPIGNAGANNVQFMLFGVDNNRTLYSYDLLQNLKLVGGAGGDSAQAIADGIVQMNALYGIDTNGDGIQDAWAGPGRPRLGHQYPDELARENETDRFGTRRAGGTRSILRFERRYRGCPNPGFPADADDFQRSRKWRRRIAGTKHQFECYRTAISLSRVRVHRAFAQHAVAGGRTMMNRQRGVVLIFSLIVLLILAIGAVAVLRSVGSSLLSAGNLAFHRDLVNQAEQAVSSVMTEFKTNGPPLNGATTADLPAANYVSTALPTNAQGVPVVLLGNDIVFSTVALPANDIPGATPDVKIRYVIDRLCTNTGTASSPNCVQSTGLPTGGTANRNTAVAPPSATVYRISVRVDGPRNTQAFLQTTFTKPD